MSTWKDKNMVISAARSTYSMTGASSAASALGGGSVYISGAAGAVRGAVISTVVDPLLGSAIKKLTDLVAGHELPTVGFQDNKNSKKIGDAAKTKEETQAEIQENKHAAKAPTGEAAERIPFRMFSLTTRTLDSSFKKRHEVDYCILSHSWKGAEVDFQYVERVRKRAAKLARAKEEGSAGGEVAAWERKKLAYLDNVGEGDQDDVALVKAQCDEDLRVLKNQIVAEFGREITGTISEWLGKISRGEITNQKAKELGKRAEKLLQTRKSADKIEQTVAWAREFFNKKQTTEKDKNVHEKFVWIDTCCINKATVGEYGESIALMGEWYANAEFCIVHLDTKPEYQNWNTPAPTKQLPDWLVWWDLFMEPRGVQSVPPNFKTFEGIEKPHWATRGWTLQELSLSRTCHFVNSSWEHLGRNSCMSISQAAALSQGEFAARTDLDDEKSYRDIAKLSSVELEEVCRGAKPSELPTVEVLRLISKRQCTVPVDQAYALMGMLGVKFPSFGAEGLGKALSRLLDEVVITSNDVSVFNWEGPELGSEIVGRSLYPKNFTAYSADPIKNPSDGAALGAQTVKVSTGDIRIYETYGKLELILSDLQEFVKSDSTKPETVALLRGAIKSVLSENLKNKMLHAMTTEYLADVAKLFRTITDNHQKMVKSFHDAAELAAKSKEKPLSSSIARTIPSISFEKPSMPSMPSFGKFGRKSAKAPPSPVVEAPPVTPPSSPPPLSPESRKSSYLSDTMDSVGSIFSSDDPEEKKFPRYLQKVVKLIWPGEQEAAEEQTEDTNKETNLDKKTLDDLFKTFSDAMNGITTDLVADLEEKNNQKKKGSSHSDHKKSYPDSKHKVTKSQTISPNPIIVTSSGLEGVFDVQRVITTINHKGRLRDEIEKNYANGQHTAKISGSCDISTGLGVIKADFRCPANMLEKQLDVEEVIEKTVLNSAPRSCVEKTLAIAQIKEEQNKAVKKDIKKDQEEGEKEDQKEDGKEEQKEDGNADSSVKRIQRMLAHIQQPEIDLVAGEWVLCRFSGVATAAWFLCSLELGSTHDFYGLRIASSRIDFGNALAQPELRDLWLKYMDEKKLGLCKLLTLALDKKKSMDDEKQHSKDVDKEIEKYSKGTGSKTDAFKSGGTFLYTKARTAWLEFEEKYRIKMLRDDALVKAGIPPSLYSAVLTLEKSATLPAMYFASRQVHMF